MNRLGLITTTGAAVCGALLTLPPAGGVARAAPAPRTLTFKGAIDLALHENPDIAGAREAVAGAQANVAGAKAKRYARLDLNVVGNLYSQEYDVNFGGMPFRLYKQYTSVTQLTISQPLTGLAYLSALVGAAEHQANASVDTYDQVRLDTAYRTADGYIRVLQARASAQVAHQSQTDIQSELDRAVQLRKADVYTDIDVFRFQSAKAQADQAALRAETAGQTALAKLVVQLGLPDGAPVEITDDLPETPPPLAMTLEQAQARAIAARPELRGAREQVGATADLKTSARERYLPDIRAVGVWEHNTGVQPFQPENAEYLGLRLSWNLWNWGETHDTVVEAEHAHTRAQISAHALADNVRLEVRQRWLEAKTAFESLAVARTQQKAAEEAYRLQKVRFDNAAATTTDVLDAQTEVARARLSLALARYDYYLALVALARSVGDVPQPAAP